MTILLHNCQELEERKSRRLKIWKGWHITLFIFAAIFGMLNYVFFYNTISLLDDNCILYPYKLTFHAVKLNNLQETNTQPHRTDNDSIEDPAVNETNIIGNDDNTTNVFKQKRESGNDTESNLVIQNLTLINSSEPVRQRLVLLTSRSFFEKVEDCQFPAYMPLLSAVFALVWTTLFTICPGGGLTRTGLQQPWRILAPSLVFAIVMVALTGYSFTHTNGGLQTFCAAFINVTNTTACSAVDAHVEAAWDVSWGVSTRIAATRAASAGTLATWICAAALLLARCLSGADFVLRSTGVLLTHDPQKKIIPHLRMSSRRTEQKRRVNVRNSREDDSAISQPTLSSELATMPTRSPQKEPLGPTVSPDDNDEQFELISVSQEPKMTFLPPLYDQSS